MWPEPDDHLVIQRMRAAHARACGTLRVTRPGDAPDVWGWRGRTIAARVTTADGPAWLKVTQSPENQVIATFWTGTVQAHQHIPAAVPRPALRQWRDWTDSRHAYRAELHDHAGAGTISGSAAVTSPPILPASWWAQVRAALASLAAVQTGRLTIQPGFLSWAMPHYLGIPHASHAGPPWTTAHGDFHFANLCAPRLAILDWEGWGLAPPGYDAATLHACSLLAPATAFQVRHELGHLLTTAAGRHAELAVITGLLHAASEGARPELTGVLRQRAAEILESPAASAPARARARHRQESG